MLSAINVSVAISHCYAQCRKADHRYAKCRYTECRGAEKSN